jgi:hypothetical protein
VRRRNFNRDIERDLATRELQFQSGYVPAWYLLDHPANEWISEWIQRSQLPDRNRSRLWEFVGEVWHYQIPAIELERETSRAGITTVFEHVNTGGLELNAFKLLTATFAGERTYQERHGHDFRLAEDWKEITEQLGKLAALRELRSTEFLQAITLLETYRRNRASDRNRPPPISARREDILSLRLDQYLYWRDKVVEGYRWVARFLADQAIYNAKFLSYSSQLVALAAIRVHLGADAHKEVVRDRLRQWFWCGVLGELYSGGIETRLARDLEEVVPWARGESGAAPRTVQDATFTATRLETAACARATPLPTRASTRCSWPMERATGAAAPPSIARPTSTSRSTSTTSSRRTGAGATPLSRSGATASRIVRCSQPTPTVVSAQAHPRFTSSSSPRTSAARSASRSCCAPTSSSRRISVPTTSRASGGLAAVRSCVLSRRRCASPSSSTLLSSPRVRPSPRT